MHGATMLKSLNKKTTRNPMNADEPLETPFLLYGKYTNYRLATLHQEATE